VHPVRGRYVLLGAIVVAACGDSSGSGATPVADASADASLPVDAESSVDAADGASGCDGSILYVSPSGTGDACSCNAPCALTTGRDHARAAAPTAAHDTIVQLAGGTYRLGQTFTLGAADSGANGHAIVYRAAPGASPVLSGAIAVTGFTPVDTTNVVWVASVPAGTRSRQLDVGGKRATRARGPDAPPGYAKAANGFALGDPAVATWPDRGKLELAGTQQWKMFRCPVSDVSAGGVTVAQPCWTNSQAQAGYTWDTVAWIENARELLDTPGEFFLDEDAAKLYYAPRPGEDLATADVELPVLEKIVDAEGTPAAPVHDVAFQGIAFEYATWLGPSTQDGYASLQASITFTGSPAVLSKPLANVTMHATHGVRFTSCRFAHLGGIALAFEVGAQGNIVDASRFEDVSASAVIVGDVRGTDDHHPSDPALIVKDNAVQGSYVTRAGVDYWDAPGLFVGYTTHTTITQNELFDLPYTGVSVGWGWGGVDVGGSGGYTTPSTSQGNVVTNNVVSHHMRALRDGGAVYVLGSQAGSSISGNVVTNQGSAYGNLYLDNGTQQYSVTNNLVLLDPKQDLSVSPDPDRSYWLYVQVYDPVAKNNTESGNFTNDPTLLTPQPIDPSNSIAAPTVVTTDLSPAASILAQAGTSLRSPEIAAGKASSASSVYDSGHPASLGNDGNAYDGWSPSGTDAQPWWQVDLGGNYALDAVEVVSRWAIDQPVTRRSYRVLASADASFSQPVVLGAVGAAGLSHRAIFGVDVAPPVVARYVRVEKTASEYFFLGEVRVHGKTAP
jgi:hypothetical protein